MTTTKQLTPSEIAYEKTFEDEKAENGAKLAKIQELYNEIRSLQNDTGVVTKKYDKVREDLRPLMYQENPECGRLCQADKERFNPTFMAASLKLSKEIGEKILKGRKRYDEDDLYNEIKRLANGQKLHHDHTDFIWKELDNRGRYIHGM